jgi:seryl-tRNA synthetase
MLDIKRIREEPDVVRTGLQRKNYDIDIDALIALDDRRRELVHELSRLNQHSNTTSKEVARLKKEKKDASAIIDEMKQVSANIKQVQAQLKQVQQRQFEQMKGIPNIPAESTPHGSSEADNVEVRRHDEGREAIDRPPMHLDIGSSLGLFDFTRGAKISGNFFPLYTGNGALLERALINYMLDTHTMRHGYREVFPPFLANADSHFGTGQLPKSADQMYYIEKDALYCIPTAEVPVTNMHRDEILEESALPAKYCAYSACFRREAGSYGKDTKGFNRVHQFNKVELVQLTTPARSYDTLDEIVSHAEYILQSLQLKYRILALCDADLSFAAARCYDIEVWAPGEKKYLEVSSCSNFEDFQARRMQIRYRPTGDKKPQPLHTLNGSGVATPRLMIALLETYCQQDGSVVVPDVLRPYMRGMERIEPSSSQ